MLIQILFLVSCLIILFMVICFIAFSSTLVVQYAHVHNVYCIYAYHCFVCACIYVYRGSHCKLAIQARSAIFWPLLEIYLYISFMLCMLPSANWLI